MKEKQPHVVSIIQPDMYIMYSLLYLLYSTFHMGLFYTKRIDYNLRLFFNFALSPRVHYFVFCLYIQIV